MVMEFLELVTSRRSVRSFRTDPVSNEELTPLFEAMRWAPSAGNAQPWRLHVVRPSALRQRLAEAALGQRFIAQAPVVLVVAVELAEAQRAYGSRGTDLYGLQDTAAALQNALLAAAAAGLGSCWVGAFREELVSEALNLPATHRPVALVPVGWPAETPQAPARRPLKDLVIHWE
jgi:nitroreductase